MKEKVIFYFPYSKNSPLEKQKIVCSLLRAKCFQDSEAANKLYLLLEMDDRVKKTVSRKIA